MKDKEMDEAVERCFERNKEFMSRYHSTPEIRKQILEKVTELWERHPSQRFGQLLENYAFGHHLEQGGSCIFHIYDETTLHNLNEALKDSVSVEVPIDQDTGQREVTIKRKR